MTTSVHVLGIRHHGPGSSRSVLRALEALRPECVLIEGPADVPEDVLALAAHEEMKPPVALLVYAADDPKRCGFYPFAEFSPEWCALRWALEQRVPVRFMDLPLSHALAIAAKLEEQRESEARPRTAETEGDDSPPIDPAVIPTEVQGEVEEPLQDDVDDILRTDPLSALAHAAGFDDGERWWEHMIEHRQHDADIFPAIRDAMVALRENAPPRRLGSRDGFDDEPLREAWMRRTIREARKEFASVAIVCGAWHSAVLDEESLASLKKEDDARLKGLPKIKTIATWTPWTHEHLASASGYGAGVQSPGWYEHLWRSDGAVVQRWMTRVSRMLRDEGLDCSSAHAIEASRLAESLAALRGRPLADLSDIADACRAIFCFDTDLGMRLIARKLLLGERLGEVPESAPAAPLQKDLQAQQKRLRLKPEALEKALDLDLRTENDLARSHLLHRLRMLSVPWGVPEARASGKGTFHELWRLRWDPVYLVRLIEYGRWGSTIAGASAAFIEHRAAEVQALPELTALLDDVLLADLPDAVDSLIQRILSVAAVGADVSVLMDAFGPLANALRYGNVRQTDRNLVRIAVAGILPRIVVGLPMATASLNDEAARLLEEKIIRVHDGVMRLDDEPQRLDWLDGLVRIARSHSVNGLIQGRCARLSFDTQRWDDAEVAGQLSLALSQGTDPTHGASWIEGFFRGSGLLLLHHETLLGILDDWLTGISAETFLSHVPLLRRTFATFAQAERRQLAERVRSADPGRREPRCSTLQIDQARAARVLPVLRRLLIGRNSSEETS